MNTRIVSGMYPRKIRESFSHMSSLADIKVRTERLISTIIIFDTVLSLIISALLYKTIKLYAIPLFFASFIAINILIYLIFILRADARGKAIEDVLPDALQLMASNLKAGLTTDKALMLAVRPEFGALSDELNIVGKEVMMGKDIGKALTEMSKRVRSVKLKEVALLVESGLKSGGELVALLTQTAQNLRNQKFIEDKIRSSIFMYFIFIFSAICFGSPILFGLSSFLVEVLTESLGSISIPETATELPISLSQISISPEFVTTFVIICLLTTCVFGSLVLGLIRKGREREGLKYMPFLIIITLGMFFLIKLIISNVFGAAFF